MLACTAGGITAGDLCSTGQLLSSRFQPDVDCREDTVGTERGRQPAEPGRR